MGKIFDADWMIAPETRRLMEVLHHAGGAARFVGGCVRNTLLNQPVSDIDIATPLTPEQVITRLDAAGIGHAPTGLKHGTVTAIIDGKTFEITTLRKDLFGYGRHADVLFTEDWRTDASRRDFSINALYADMDGNIYDYFGGMKDLRLGRVAFIGDPDKRIQEDILRILRFFRFYAWYGQGEADARGLAACARLSKLIPRLSAERIRQEAFKILDAPKAPGVWRLMSEQGIVTYFLPEATNLRALEKMAALEHDHQAGGYYLRRLAAVLDVTPGGIKNIAASLKLSNEQAQQLAVLVETQVAPDMTPAVMRQLVYKYGNDMARNLLLVSAARSTDKLNTKHIADLYNIATVYRVPRFPLKGDDALNLGVAAGPAVGALLSQVEEWWMGEDFWPGRTACLEKLKEFAGL